MPTASLIFVVAAVVIAVAAMVCGFLASRDDEVEDYENEILKARCHICGEGLRDGTALFIQHWGPPRVWSCIVDLKTPIEPLPPTYQPDAQD